MPGTARTGAPLFDTAGLHDAVVRLSRASGTPRPLPDAYGVAFRVKDQDLLLTTTLDLPVIHHLPLPSPGQWSWSYSSLLAFRVGGAVRLIGAIPRPATRSFDVALARLGGRWGAPVATLRLTEPLPADRTDALRFDPWRCSAGIVPVGPFQRVRRPVYRGSQRAR